MLNPSKFLSRILNFYTFSIGGGVGEAAMYGALFGAAKNAVSGEDILSGLVTGGALSAATAGLGGELLGEGAKTAAESAATTIPQDSMVGALTNAGADAATSAATNPSLMGLGGMQNVAATQGAGISALPESSGLLSGASTSVPGQGVAQFTQQTPTSTLRNMAGSDSMVGKGLDWWDKQGQLDKAMYSGLAGAGVGALSAKPPALPGQPKEEDNPFGFATYDRNSFTPTDVQPNVYRPGPGYAVGGAIGMGNQMFPQGQQDHTQYATPTQMPTSREVIDSGYEQATNPYTGDAVVGMAAGGVTHQQIDDYLKGSMMPTPTRTPAAPVAVKDPNAAQVNQQANLKNAMGAKGSGYSTLPQFQQATGMANYAFNPNANQWLQPGQYNPYNVISPMYSGAMAATPDSFIAPNYKPSYAEGGIAGLGGYAAGGNPRLLKGPGDGMSDDIPATISGKQPARLADGEFVVPADVVSHLGNGSTDAGAKHLYSMMDKVRKARTGRKAQGKQIKPEKFIPA